MNIKKLVITVIIHLIIGMLLGTLLLILAYSIPTERIQENVKKSALEIIQKEGLYPEVTHLATSYLDNWTDSIMLAEAAHPTGSSPAFDAMQVPHYESNEFPDQSLVFWATTGTYLRETTYARYWHGYLVILKPMLTVLDYGGIRILNGICQTMLTATIAVFLWKSGKRRYIIPWLISVAMLMPVALAKSLQYSSCYYIFSLSAMMMLCYRKQETVYLLFLWAGILTAYFDFLTYPISTFGIPAVFSLICFPENNRKLLLKRLLIFGVIWAMGYVLMWGSKFLVGSLITGINYFAEAKNRAGYWFDGEQWFHFVDLLYLNVRAFIYTPISFLALAFILTKVLLSIRKKTLNRAVVYQSAPYMLIALLPFCWYLVLFNHSGTHYNFTNKACIVTAFSGLCMVANFTSVDISQKA